MWNNYPGQQQQHQHHQHHQQGGYGPPLGPPPGQGAPGFPSPPAGFGGGFGFPGVGGFNAPPGPPPGPYGVPPGPPPAPYGAPPGPPLGQSPNSGYAPSYGPPPVPPRQYGGSNYGEQGGGYGGTPGGSYGGYGGGDGNRRDYGAFSPPASAPPPNYGSYPAPGGAPHMPPSETQNYGPHYQGADNRDSQPYFQYSQCTGKKKAVCIGINYMGQKGELRGCINDAQNVQSFLISHGYKADDIVMLTDDAQNPRKIPTKQNIIDAMQWLVRDAQPNDSLFFHYSGHGGQTKDLDGDEADGFDEVIYPVDYEMAGHIVDDELHAIMVRRLPAGCRLTSIFDSCHSGSVLDLPYIYSTEGKIKEPNLAAEVGQGLFGMAKSYARSDMSGVIKGAMGLFKTASGNTQKAEKYARETRTSPADVISWSGCKDSQTSADTVEAGSATGAMSFAFISSLSQQPQQTYQELLNNLRDILRSKYSQKPQLSSSHPMDTSIYFIF